MRSDSSHHGFFFALAAYFTWGLAPIYFKWLGHVPATEIIAHRIIWSLILLMSVLLLTKNLGQLRTLLTKLPWLMVTAVLVSTNWLLFVWAITHERITETSLGYYINPLVSVVLAGLFLGERLRPLQMLAFAVAALGVLVRLIHYGTFPWIALGLALSFGFYGLVRKKIQVPAISGLAVETFLLAPFAVGFLIWLNFKNGSSFSTADIRTDLLLVVAGLVTTFPLLCFAAAVVRLSLTTMGIMQYIAPSMTLVMAVFLYKEPFVLIDLVSFFCIWLALAVFTIDSYRFMQVYQGQKQSK